MPANKNIITGNWEASSNPKLLSLEPYRHLFPKAKGNNWTVKRNAGVSHTVKFIPQVVKQYSWQVEKYVAKELRHLPLEQACRKLWWFVRFHIEWVRDETGYEQVRSGSRLISDGKGDCDCMTTFVDSCMYVYGVRGITNRIVAYDYNDNFSHIYSLIPDGKGGHYIIDCCFPYFNKQKKYTKKEDYNMDLQFLDGIEDTRQPNKRTYSEYSEGSDNIMGELGKLLKRNANKQGGGGLFKKKTPEQKQAAKEKRQNFGKKALKVINKVNKINPATALLRAGILASMKLNILKVAERIKWAYASPELTESKGMDMSKYDKLKGALAKAEKIFFAAGGKPENLKKAILTGHGNRNHEVAGIDGLNGNTPLPELLGAIYQDEFINGMDGFEGLGEPATAASITAAAGAMGALAALLASIGTLFPKKDKSEKKARKGKRGKKAAQETTEESGGENATTTEEPPLLTPSGQTRPEDEENGGKGQAPEETENTPATSEEAETPSETTETEAETETSSEETAEPETAEETTEGLSGLTGIKAFYQANKNWINPVAGFAGGVLATVIVYEIFSGPGEEKKPSQQLHGAEDIADKQSVIALM